ncbi:nicotinamide riboside transporter PnuC [Planktosalinus lacus]|uniref:Nicotinamide riboside transporter PnuC n=1 Tax=Planktosalinus lacus TaxID=1526573 RepID=A0A8J2VBB5_9FLAO|nr:nicotinamide riboside transporter PnuC [Planktosalinus lacus]GGD96077.1 nicotinamide mononucleotide transporter [Planktosalinus lacus]
MSLIFDWLFSQYSGYSTLFISLEIIAVFFGLLSVWYAKKDNILVFPTGIISTSIFVYLLYQWGLIGDMLINGYYFSMSVYGWYIWTRKVDAKHFTPITTTSKKEKLQSVILFIAGMSFVFIVYQLFDKWNDWVAYVDTLTTAIFFVGMWLMAKKKIENWLYWIVGDLISIPLYFYKGYTFTSLQYLIFTIIAIYGYLEWKKIINNPKLQAKTS